MRGVELLSLQHELDQVNPPTRSAPAFIEQTDGGQTSSHCPQITQECSCFAAQVGFHFKVPD